MQDEFDKFERAAQRLDVIRYARAIALLSPLKRHLLRLIPIFLHYHAPKLPGYNGPLTPSGIVDYQFLAETTEACETLEIDLSNAKTAARPLIEGIYSMGSTASFGQNPQSDIDVWLIHSDLLSKNECELLASKAVLLTQWFAKFDLEVNFYLVHPEQFIREQGEQADLYNCMGHEHSGSAQHWLLLEEFYRSQFRLAGRPIAWWPNAKKSPKLLTLGDANTLPASEYFGASLWQLYKGVEKPHKALLKVLLLEAYASDYPNTQLVSERIWQHTLKGDFSAANDAYYLLYESIESYLKKHGDNRRLEITRRCFYLKCGVKLSRHDQAVDWRYFKMQKLVADWNWSESLLKTLDHCENWHCGQLQWFNEQLNELMLGSYRTLLQFASTHRLSESLRISELGLLTRKLHTYFSEDAHQIMRLNPLWSRSILEPHLSVIYSEQDKSYYLYRCSPNPKNFLEYSAVFHSKSKAKLLVWASLNGVADSKTHWHEVRQSKRKSTYLTHAGNRLDGLIVHQSTKVSKMALYQPWHFSKLVFLLNFNSDPTESWQGQDIMVDYMNSNVFSIGRRHLNMVDSIDVISLNSWGEWHCHHFEGEKSILDALSFVTPGMKRASATVSVEVISCSSKLRSQTERTVQNLLYRAVRLSRQAQSSTTLGYALQVGRLRYGLFFNNRGMHYENLSDAKSFYQQLSQRKLLELPRPTLGDEPFAKVPAVIQDYAAKGAIQYFLRQREEGLDVFILDEKNELNHYVQEGTDVDALVNKLSHYHTFEDPQLERDNFNLPQFFKLDRVKGELVALPFGVTQESSEVDF
ncbi:putative adenylate cyclase [Shewanella halifaxensis HAW-EB4]|uniref:Adenylate cyclase n=1 Tax=Shewanella halifaxensis (strain HAW-EB4) TaxID=458817 RepID=B0TJ53_SHEHH|nr:class I adenylate cyclase [Shewanella halifaxensis]ABZ78456.1 putative adenylate cyclase [Shewanella halifaxensis HAW-EB4]